MDYINQIEERYGKGKPSVGLPQIFTDIQNLLKLVKEYEKEVLFHNPEYDGIFEHLKKEIFGAK